MVRLDVRMFLIQTYELHDDLFYDSMINSVKNNWQIDSGLGVSSDGTGTTFSYNGSTRYIKLPVSETNFAMEFDYITGSGNTPMGIQTWNGDTWVSYATHRDGKYVIESTSTQNYTSSVQTNVHCKYIVNGTTHSFYVGEQLIGSVTKKTATGTFYIGFYATANCTSQKIKNVEIKPL